MSRKSQLSQSSLSKSSVSQYPRSPHTPSKRNKRKIQRTTILTILITLIISLIAELAYGEAIMQTAHCSVFLTLHIKNAYSTLQNAGFTASVLVLCKQHSNHSRQQAHSQQLTGYKLIQIILLHHQCISLKMYFLACLEFNLSVFQRSLL